MLLLALYWLDFCTLSLSPNSASEFCLSPLRLEPLVCILENVKGLKKVLRRVLRLLRALPYWVAALTVDSSTLGTPVDRDRYYIIMIHMSGP